MRVSLLAYCSSPKAGDLGTYARLRFPYAICPEDCVHAPTLAWVTMIFILILGTDTFCSITWGPVDTVVM